MPRKTRWTNKRRISWLHVGETSMFLFPSSRGRWILSNQKPMWYPGRWRLNVPGCFGKGKHNIMFFHTKFKRYFWRKIGIPGDVIYCVQQLFAGKRFGMNMSWPTWKPVGFLQWFLKDGWWLGPLELYSTTCSRSVPVKPTNCWIVARMIYHEHLCPTHPVPQTSQRKKAGYSGSH